MDNTFAAYTDDLLSGNDVVSPDDLRDLGQVARQLKTLLADDRGPSTEFRTRLTQRLTDEWAQAGPSPNRSRIRFTSWSILGTVAAVAAVLLIGLVIITNGTGNNLPTSGFAIGPITLSFAIIASIFVVVLVIFSLRGRR